MAAEAEVARVAVTVSPASASPMEDVSFSWSDTIITSSDSVPEVPSASSSGSLSGSSSMARPSEESPACDDVLFFGRSSIRNCRATLSTDGAICDAAPKTEAEGVATTAPPETAAAGDEGYKSAGVAPNNRLMPVLAAACWGACSAACKMVGAIPATW